MTVEAIKDAIRQLPEGERASLAAWINEMEYDEWDKEMLKDFSPGGRGMEWVEEAKREAAPNEKAARGADGLSNS
jgi:hypothetical protein